MNDFAFAGSRNSRIGSISFVVVDLGWKGCWQFCMAVMKNGKCPLEKRQSHVLLTILPKQKSYKFNCHLKVLVV